MHKLSDSITRKFVESFDVSDWEVETEDGYVDIASSNKTIEYLVYEILLDNGLSLKCADNHILIDSAGREVFAKDSLGVSIKTKLGDSRVISVLNLGYAEHMYDLSVASEDHTYFTGGILSHNTTTSAAYILWYTLFQSSKTVAILANKASAAREVMSRYQLMFECLPKWMQQGVVTWNKGDVELENGSKVFTAATTASGIRGKSVNLLYVDETAIIPNTVAEQFFASVYPTISAGSTTKILLSSTPLGYNHFWKFWNDAENDRNGFVPLFIPYWEIPGRDEKWAEEQLKLLGEVKFNQEVLCKFLGSSLTLISGGAISQMSPSAPIFSKDGLDIYEKPVKGKIYMLVADTAKGVGIDYSAFTVVDITQTPYKLVAKYRDNTISPMLYPSVIYKVAKEFNEAFVLIEINTSEQVANILWDEYEYEHIVMVNKSADGQQISAGFGGHGKTMLGVTTDKRVKRVGCANFKTLIEEKRLLIPDVDVISEISTFIAVKNSFEADDGYHDDLVMTLVLFSWAVSNQYFQEINSINIRQVIYENQMAAIEKDLTPFGFFDDGQPPSDVLPNF